MPFTFSHPAAAAPFSRFGLNLSALVVGSMSPDFIYFLLMTPRGEMTHTIGGVFLFCMPASLLALLVYHHLLKEPVAALLPAPFQKAILASEPLRLWPARKLIALLIGILLGALTHLAWDAFTHEGGWAGQLLPFLNMNVMDLGFDQVPLARILHHAGSIFGLSWIALQAKRLLSQSREGSEGVAPSGGSRWRAAGPILALIVGSSILGLAYAWIHQNPVTNYDIFRRMMVQGLVASGSFLTLLLAGYGILWHLAVKKEAVSSKQ